jgi:hypothetical protein
MPSETNDFTLLNHYTILIYPFLHDVTSDARQTRLRLLEESWDPWWARLDGNIHQVLDDSYFFLPYIREVVFPEAALLKDTQPGDRYAHWVKRIQQWNAKGLNYFCSELTPEAVLRLTYNQKLVSSIRNIEILPLPVNGVSGEEALPLRLEWVDALLFPTGVGFIMTKVVLSEDSPQLSRLIDLNYYLRTVHPPFTDWKLPELRVGRMAYTVKMRDLMDFLIQGMTGDHAIIPNLTQFIDHLRQSQPRRYSEGEAGQVYGERCHFFSYASVDMKDDETTEALRGNFASVTDRVLFETASSIPIGDSINNPVWVPALAQVSQLREQNQIAIWQIWRGMALKDSVVFLGTEDVNFNRVNLPHNVEYDYLPLYLYSLYQKYQLFVFADELMRKGAYVAQHLQEVRDLMDRFMDFRNRYWFNEVTRKPLGGDIYRKFQQGLESQFLYEMVSSQVKDLKEYYEERRQRRIDLLLNLFTFAFLPLSAVIGVFGMTFFTGSWWSFVITFVVTVAISVGLWSWWTEEIGPPRVPTRR